MYDVNKCSWCVQGNHRRCHGPCNCAHLAVHANRTEPPEEACGACGGSKAVDADPWPSDDCILSDKHTGVCRVPCPVCQEVK